MGSHSSCDSLASLDPELAALVRREHERQSDTIDLIASENHVSHAVRTALSTLLTDKYAEGYPGRRYYSGCGVVDHVETLAITRAKALFGAEHANVQPHSGAQANMAVYLAVMQPGDTLLGMDLTHGGHLTHGHPLNYSGKEFRVVAYGVDRETETIDYERLFAVVLPRHAVEGTDLLADWSSTPWPSAGPFRFTGWADATPHGAAGSVAIFARNEKYWRTDAADRPLPYLDTATFRFVADDRQAIAGFAQGSFDAIDLGAWPDVITRLGKLEGVTVAQGDGTVWEHLAFQFGVNNRNRDSLNGSVDFRRAVAHAIDREALAALPGWVNDGALGSFLDLSPVPGGDGWARYAYDGGPGRRLPGRFPSQACASLW